MVIYQSDEIKTSKYVQLQQATSSYVDLVLKCTNGLAVRRCKYDC